MKWRSIRLSVLLAAVFGVMRLGWAEDGAITVDELLRRQQQYFETLKTIQYSVTHSLSSAPPHSGRVEPEYESRFVRQAKYTQKGSSFRFTNQFVENDNSQESPETTLAYDGKRYQALEHEGRWLRVKREFDPAKLSAGYGPQLPEFAIPFAVWAYAPDDWEKRADFHATQWLAQSSAWDYVRANSRLAGNEDVNGNECLVLRMDKPNTSGTNTDPHVYSLIYFAKDYEYFPVKRQSFYQTDSGYVLGLNEEVTGLAMVKGESGDSHIVYDKFTSFKYSEGYTVKEELVFDKGQFKINESVDDSLFTIDPSSVFHYRNEDDPSDRFDIEPVNVSALIAEEDRARDLETSSEGSVNARSEPAATIETNETGGARSALSGGIGAVQPYVLLASLLSTIVVLVPLAIAIRKRRRF